MGTGNGGEMKWVIGDVHPIYGECQMMGITGGESYRWFIKEGSVSMIPLSMLEKMDEEAEDD